MTPPKKGTPDVTRLVERLKVHEVRYVLIGSVAAMTYGAQLMPGDFDITPDLNPTNLRRLAQLLVELEATPDAQANAGHWEEQNGERRWVTEPLTPARVAALKAWTPDPQDLGSFDHLFETTLGNFDVVPELMGRYEVLRVRAVPQVVAGVEVQVAHVDDLLHGITVPRREKDGERVRFLREVQKNQAVWG